MAIENLLIARLPARDRLSLLAACDVVRLEPGQVLYQRGQSGRHVYFPVGCFISLVRTIEGQPRLEVGLVGNEGMHDPWLSLDAHAAALQAVVRGAGTARRIRTGLFRRELALSKPLQRTMGRYLCVLMAQLATSVACTRFHAVAPRLARWLLMSHDRAHADTFHLTHELLACTLGVRRVGITCAAGELQRRGIIKYHRGSITVLDRAGLEAAACSCYASDRSDYAQALGPGIPGPQPDLQLRQQGP